MLKALLTTVTAVAVVEMREDIANATRYALRETKKAATHGLRSVKERVDATRR